MSKNISSTESGRSERMEERGSASLLKDGEVGSERLHLHSRLQRIGLMALTTRSPDRLGDTDQA